MIVFACIIYINYLKSHTLNMYPKCRFRVHVPRIRTRFASLGYIFRKCVPEKVFSGTHHKGD
ncbi:hypothetical protein HMPREF1989_01054 [Porphyromonas gingivalis F0566]|nr:hypothetical protein HMPREF1989_01054 [Porphyromonas gingivalis F0566]